MAAGFNAAKELSGGAMNRRIRLLASVGAFTSLIGVGEALALQKAETLYAAAAKPSEGLTAALGPAAYILDDARGDEEFRRAVKQAIGRHPIFNAEASTVSQNRAATRAARAALYPRLSASVTGDYVIDRRFGAGTDNVVESLRPEAQFNVGATASQLLFDGGAAFARIRSAKARGRESALTLDARINELALAALSAHHDLAVHKAIIAVGGEYIARHRRLVGDLEERERLGAGSKADVLRARARLAAARARVSQFEESARAAEIRYAEFFADETPQLRLPSYEAMAVASRAEAVSLALARTPAVAAAAARSESAKADYKAVKASQFPEIRGTVSGVKFDVLDSGDDYDIRAGVNVNYDLFAGGARGAAISEARGLAEHHRYQEDQVRREIEREAAIAFERKSTAATRLSALEDAIVANHKARDLVAERFRVARGDLLDLLQAENDWFEAGVAYLAGLADRDMANFELMEFTGDLHRFFSPRSDGVGE